MQLTFKSAASRRRAASLVELRPGEQGVLERLDLPDEVSRRLMELGFLPGNPVVAALSAPGGDPRVFRVDGAEIALRRETAARLLLRDEGRPSPAGA
jgi:Fe2+ transport system protein FeoA